MRITRLRSGEWKKCGVVYLVRGNRLQILASPKEIYITYVTSNIQKKLKEKGPNKETSMRVLVYHDGW